ncbi:hypothetical protein AeNC1_013730 [Aphanomyces euteiches]|nr:hypothetical protein AeNC1_013730 [Aphanomyces euteiches]
MKMPLPPHYFQCPPLSPEECEQYERQALQDIQDSLEKADITNPRYEWKRIADEAEIEIFRGIDPYRPTSATLFCSTVDIAGTIDEVANFYTTRTPNETKEMIDRTELALLDAADLYTIHESQDLDIRMQWFLEKTPFDLMLSRADGLQSTQFLDPDGSGRQTWVRCIKSVDMLCCPEFTDIIRAVQYGSGLVCRESARAGYVELKTIVHCDLRGTLPRALKKMPFYETHRPQSARKPTH